MDKFMIDPKEENRMIYREPSKLLPEPSKLLPEPSKLLPEPSKLLPEPSNNINPPFYYGYLLVLPVLLVIFAIAYFIYTNLYDKKSTYLMKKNESKYEISLDEIKEEAKNYLRSFVNRIQEWKDYFAGFYHKLLFNFYVDKDTVKTVRYKN